MDRIELQLCLIQAVYRARAPQETTGLDELRGRCEALLDGTEPQVAGPRVQALVEEIRLQLHSSPFAGGTH